MERCKYHQQMKAIVMIALGPDARFARETEIDYVLSMIAKARPIVWTGLTEDEKIEARAPIHDDWAIANEIIDSISISSAQWNIGMHWVKSL